MGSDGWDTCSTEEDLESLMLKYEAVRDCVREKLKALEDDSRVMVGAADSHELRYEEIDSIFESLKGQIPALAALLIEGDGFSTSRTTRPPGDGKDLADGNGSLAVEPTPVPSDLGDFGFDPEDPLNLFEDLDGPGGGFLTSPEDSAVGGGSSRVNGYDLHDFAALEELDVRL
ncbi:hypothetical protein NL676_030365 [Syzygium grande]|nr:hypothetical protein NL676_030365 [Syzygium grande]